MRPILRQFHLLFFSHILPKKIKKKFGLSARLTYLLIMANLAG